MPGALALPYVKLASTKAWCPLTSMTHWDVDTQTYRHPAVLARTTTAAATVIPVITPEYCHRSATPPPA
eukprot:COSAG01_NODE_65648_length_272_cov_1.491329_1_plen_68_part_10